MYHTNAAYKQKVAELPQDFRMEIEVVFDESTGLTENVVIPPEDIFEAGLSENVFLNTFCVGSSVCTEFWVRIFNQDGKYKNDALATAEIHPKVTLYDSESGEAVDTVPLGIFYVEQITIQDSDLRLACYDKMRLLEKAYTPKSTQTSLLSVAQDIALSVLASCSTTPADMPALSLVVDDTIFQGYTKRQVLELIAEAGGRFAIFDPDGALCFKWFTESGIELSGDKAKEALELNGNTFSLDGNVVKVTGVRVVSEDTELARVGTDDYLLTINENPIAAAHPSEVAQYVLASMADTQYIPCKWQRIGGDPSLQVGDILTIVDNKETFDETQAESYDRYPLFLSARSWTFNCGGFSDVYTSSGNAEKDLNTDKGMTVSKRLSQLAKRITETKSDLTAEMDDRQKALLLFNETIAGSMGLYTTYKTQEDGSVVLYMHDEKELEQSQTIYTFGTNGFAWTNTGWNDGNPVWETGFDRNGNAILNAIYAYTLTADVITSGILKSQNGASWINMNDGTFSFGYVDKWLDIDTGETEEDYHTVLSLENKVLNIYGVLRGIKYPNVSIAIGQSANGDVGSFSVTDSNIGDLFTVETSVDGSTVRLGFPIFEQTRYASRGLTASEDGLTLYYSQNGGDGASVYCGADGAGIQSNNAFFRAYRDQFNFSTLSGHTHCWFNFYAPDTGNAPTAYDFGNGAGDHADILCAGVECESISCSSDDVGDLIARFNGRITVGGNTSWENTALNVTGDTYIVGGCYANNFYNNSSRDFKTNIQPQNMQALPLIKNMAFYSYDYKTAIRNKDAGEETSESNAHVNIGLIANEAPSVILSKNQDAVDLYEYISLTAKAVQELAKKIEEQAQKISALEAEIAELKK